MSDLVTKVREAVRPHLYSEGGNSEVVARAAIKAVAEWLGETHPSGTEWLRNRLLAQLEDKR
ncbi:MAG: hypothetical protein E6Q97_15760 [Desulfurellales bacterium]|nr:MAG: hypothetical protein E6Q97_15760 [Desulfurellales bacterium]